MPQLSIYRSKEGATTDSYGAGEWPAQRGRVCPANQHANQPFGCLYPRTGCVCPSSPLSIGIWAHLVSLTVSSMAVSEEPQKAMSYHLSYDPQEE